MEDSVPIHERTTVCEETCENIDTVFNEIYENGLRALKITTCATYITYLPNCRCIMTISIWKNISCKIADDNVAYLLSDLQLNYLFRVKLQFYQQMFNQQYVL